MPSGTAFAPRAGPEDVPVLGQARLPQGKVGQRILGVFVAGHPVSEAHPLEVEDDQLTIAAAALLILLDAEIDRAIRRPISNAPTA